ncbi:FACT complex subunit [Geranomyces michiganensis]|nr:FACT complex subunit [Geranomyces michiganensis]
MSRSFENVFLGGSNSSKVTGLLKVAEAGLGWKNSLNGNIVKLAPVDIQKVSWQRCARDYQLRVQKKDGTVIKFDGLQKEAYDIMAPIMKIHWHKNLERRETSVRGWNWGAIEFQGNQMAFNVANHPAFEVPLSEVANTNAPSKNEVLVEFATPEVTNGDAKRKGASEDALVEVRFFVPGASKQDQATVNEKGVKIFKDADASSNDTADGDENGEEADGEEFVLDEEGDVVSSAMLLVATIREKADVDLAHGEPVASFENQLCLTPRGRFDVELHLDFFRLRGKSHDYKVMYSSIHLLSLLPKPDDMHHMFVIGLDPPLRQGQTRYPFLVFQIARDEETTFDIAMEDDVYNDKYAGVLKKNYDGPIYEVLSEIMKGLTGKKITAPSDSFSSAHAQSGIKCAHKANEAFLYPLERSILSIPKPPIFISHAEISAVTFSRVDQTGGSNALKTFEIKFNLREGQEHTFGSVAREEYEPLERFFRSKKLKVINDLGGTVPGSYREDSDGASDGEGVSRKRVRQETGAGYDDEDEDSSEDEDFAPEQESDVAEEFDENYGSGSDAEDGDAEPSRKKTAELSEGEGSGDDEKQKAEPVKTKSKSSYSKEPAKKKAKKEKKDGPKRGQTSFLYFSKDKRSEILAEFPGLALPEVSKKLGEAWKAVSPEEKAKYEDMAKADKERYEKEKEDWPVAAEGSSSKKSSAKQKASGSKRAAAASPGESSGKFKSEEFVESDSD